MAAPHGDRWRSFKTGFTEFVTPEASHDDQVGSPKSHTIEFDDDALGCTSSSFHSSLEPSILSIFENSSAEETKIQIDEESEASLLSAFSEMLDSVIEDTLSPFDTLPDSKLFLGQSCQDSRVRSHCLDREAAPRVTRSFTPSNSKVEGLYSDRQLRPRLCRRSQTTTVQRSDGEEEDLSETRRRPVRIFRIESDPEMWPDEQKDGSVLVSLVDLVRHMHPYCLRVAAGKKESLREDVEDVFVDVVGDDSTEETPLVMPLASSPVDLGSEQIVPHRQNPAVSSIVHNSKVCQENMLKMCSPNSGEQNKEKSSQSVLVKSGNSRRDKKKVRFASDLATIHMYQVEDEAHERDGPDASSLADHTDDLRMADCDSQTLVSKKTTSPNGKAKLKMLSLQEYRLLRQKMVPKEERKADYRTKWPSVPETLTQLPPIPCLPGYKSSQVNVQMSSSNAKTSTPGTVAMSRRNLHLPLKSFHQKNALVRKPVHAVDPPNPVTVSLQPNTKSIPPLSDGEVVIQHEIGKSQAKQANQYPPARVPNFDIGKQPLMVSPEDFPDAKSKRTNCSLKVSSAVKTPPSASSSPLTVRPVQMSHGRLPQVQTPVTNHSAGEKTQESTGEKGIEATDVTSLLEQFEMQGLTPPATPPHQTWKPLKPTLKAKQHVIKPSPSKTIQIIEPKPLPHSKIQSKPQNSSSIPAPSLFLAFIDHDYCSTQDFRLTKKRSRSLRESRNHMSHMPVDNRTCCKAERLSGSVLLSPESSPCRLKDRRTDECTEAARDSHCSCSPRPPPRGRSRRRRNRGKYHHSDSSSVSSSRSPSCSSSDSSCSPPRKRYQSWRSDSSSSSSRSSSCSLSPSPIRGCQHYHRRTRSRSFSRSRSRSHSPHPDWRQNWSSWKRQREYCQLSRGEDTCRLAKQKAMEERRVVYVGRIRGSMTKEELTERFELFGKIEDCTVHFRSHGDNYGFVTYYNTHDAFAAIEKGTKLRKPDELPFDVCFGGRRQFCQSNYMDLDSNRDMDPAPRRSQDNTLGFDALLEQAQRGLKT